MKKSKFDFTPGTRYGRLVLTGESESRKTKSGTKRYEKCVCDCGNVVRLPRVYLTSGTKSCGCLWLETIKKRNSTHGMGESRIYSIYSGMKTRCNNPHEKTYKNYGARGIKCLWESFEDFYRDMGESYEAHVKEYGEKDTTIERIDVDGDYCKDNCTWKTKQEQANNLRTNTVVIIDGVEHNITEWSRILGIPRETFRRNVWNGKIKCEIYKRGDKKYGTY